MPGTGFGDDCILRDEHDGFEGSANRITLYIPLTDSLEMMLEPAFTIMQQKWARNYVESLIKKNTQMSSIKTENSHLA
uniref:Uncharacterized protein n=1 Tax=Romanomermis culicivorax TaxID=13658 RepID=A0A915KMY6_ROMCU